MTSTRTFTHEELAVSPLNVRFNEEDANAVTALAASIVQDGLIQPLTLHTIKGKPDWSKIDWIRSPKTYAQFGVYAGGRRYRAIRMAILDGRLPADFPITANIRDLPDGEIVLLSLEENLLRRDLRPYEVHAAIARAAGLGLSPQQIADRSGQSPAWVAQQLRLGDLHPPIFAAYCAGTIAADQAKAFAATDDLDLQAAAWKHFEALPAYERSEDRIRAWMKIGDRQLMRQLLFVGEAVYRAKGGRFELDLFAGDQCDRGRIVDDTLLRDLVEEKMVDLRSSIRAQTGERDLRFAVEPPKFGAHADHSLQIHDVQTRTKGGGEKYRLPKAFPVEDIVATIDLQTEGDWTVGFYWKSCSAKNAFEKSRAKAGTSPARSASLAPTSGEAINDSGGFYDPTARRIARDEHGLTSDGVEAVRSLRADLLRAAIITDAEAGGTLGRDYRRWAHARALILRERSPETGLLGSPQRDGGPHTAIGVRSDQLAFELWSEALDGLAHEPFIIEQSQPASLELYCKLPEKKKTTIDAILAAAEMVRSANTPGYRVPVHNTLAQLLGLTDTRVRLFFKPTPVFTGMFSKMARLGMAQPFVDPQAFKAWSKLADKPLSGAVSGALEGVEGGTRGQKARRWLHRLLTFGVAEPDHAQNTAERPVKQLEPAE